MSIRLVMRDGLRAIRCKWPGCDFASPSGLEMTKHNQRVHVSRNEPGASVVFPAAYVPGGMPITDMAAVRERLRPRRPYETGPRAIPASKWQGRRVA